ncbi:MAG: 1-deoxy-D-xylulose-5-phosphate reductoisomerase [Pirellulaceae bacterium]|nr:1-deoxy-D-xylulose-5-phosphate reductoisomerase [Pirellulaceae bacterium]
MNHGARNVAILGSTGSVGCSALDVVRSFPESLNVVALTAHGRLQELVEQAQEFAPRFVVASDPKAAQNFAWQGLPPEVELFVGPESIECVAAHQDVDVVVTAIVGSAGLRGTWAALEAGKTIALANKETLVVAGSLAMALAERHRATILPVDSEHNAVFQAMEAGRREDVQRVILTASGGPFLRHSLTDLQEIQVAEALSHPTWSMGPKITVDSATMMNKALEIIEARWLFGLQPNQIDVAIHPQSIVHSLVEFSDGSVLAQMSPPDMKLPIQYALSYPERWDGPARRMDFSELIELSFEPPDEERFPALQIGHEVAAAGGTSGAVVNAANEAAVASFLSGQMRFTDIVPTCRTILNHHDFDPDPTLEELLILDAWAREEVTRWVCT